MLSDIEFGERSGRVIFREDFGNKARTVPLNASACLALAVYLAPQRGFYGKKVATPFPPKGAHISQLYSTSYLFVKNTLKGQLLKQSMAELLTLRADCSLVALKPDHSSRLLP